MDCFIELADVILSFQSLLTTLSRQTWNNCPRETRKCPRQLERPRILHDIITILFACFTVIFPVLTIPLAIHSRGSHFLPFSDVTALIDRGTALIAIRNRASATCMLLSRAPQIFSTCQRNVLCVMAPAKADYSGSFEATL